MRHARYALAEAQPGSRAPAGEALEPLEPRMVLSAPTLTPLAPEASMTRLVLPIQYHSDAPIDVTSIGNGDIGVTGPNGFSQLAQLLSPPTVLSNGDVVARYVVRPTGGPWAQWEWPAANGTYNVGIVAGAVRNTAGEANAGGGAGSWWLWFNTARIVSTSQQVQYGQGPFAYDHPRQDGWAFGFTLAFPQRTYAGGSLAVHVTGPNGFDSVIYARQPYFYDPRETVMSTGLSGIITPRGGTWDFSDSGAYTVQVSVPEYVDQYHVRPGDVLSTQSFTLNLTAPRAELVSTTVGIRDLTATIRYTPAPGAAINLASITNSDITVTVLAAGELAGQLVQPPTLNPDGTVTATYRASSPSSGGWNYLNTGYTIQTRFNEVTDTAGHPVGVGNVGEGTLAAAMPSVRALRTVIATSIAWDIEVSYNNVGGVIDTARLGNGGIALYDYQAGFGQYMPTNATVQLQSFSNSADNILTVRYRVTPPSGTVLRDTNYHLLYGAPYLQGVSYPVLTPQYASLDMHFAQAAVMGLRTLGRTSTAWDIEVSYSNPRLIISTGSLGTQNLVVTAPAGRTVRLSMISFATGSDQVLRVRYRLLAATNGGTLARGTYGFALRSGSVFAAGVALPAQFIASMTI